MPGIYPDPHGVITRIPDPNRPTGRELCENWHYPIFLILRLTSTRRSGVISGGELSPGGVISKCAGFVGATIKPPPQA